MQTASQVTDERRRCERGPGRDHSRRDRIQQLFVRQPMKMHHKIRAQERQQHVSASVGYRSDLEECQEQPRHAERNCTGRSNRDGRQRNLRQRSPRPGRRQWENAQSLPLAFRFRVAGDGREHGRNRDDRHNRNAAKIECERSDRHQRQPHCLKSRSPQAQQRIGDDRNHHWIDSVQNPLRRWKSAVAHIRPGKRENHQHGRQNEQHPGQNQRRPSRAPVTERDHRLRGRRPWYQIHDPEKIEKILLRNPFPAIYQLSPHHRDVSRGAAIREQSQLQKKSRHLAQISAAHARRNWIGLRHFSVVAPACPETRRHPCAQFASRSNFAWPALSLLQLP